DAAHGVQLFLNRRRRELCRLTIRTNTTTTRGHLQEGLLEVPHVRLRDALDGQIAIHHSLETPSGGVQLLPRLGRRLPPLSPAVEHDGERRVVFSGRFLGLAVEPLEDRVKDRALGRYVLSLG